MMDDKDRASLKDLLSRRPEEHCRGLTCAREAYNATLVGTPAVAAVLGEKGVVITPAVEATPAPTLDSDEAYLCFVICNALASYATQYPSEADVAALRVENAKLKALLANKG